AAGSTPAIAFTPDDNADYVISVAALGVEDHSLGSGSATIRVANVAPTFSITGAPAGLVDEGTPINLGSTTPFDPGTVDTAAGFVYRWTVIKDGDTLHPFAKASTPGLSFTPDDHGNYDVTLAVIDKDSG